MAMGCAAAPAAAPVATPAEVPSDGQPPDEFKEAAMQAAADLLLQAGVHMVGGGLGSLLPDLTNVIGDIVDDLGDGNGDPECSE
jgi:hypothetical protein